MLYPLSYEGRAERAYQAAVVASARATRVSWRFSASSVERAAASIGLAPAAKP